jgi:hypothetical protein
MPTASRNAGGPGLPQTSFRSSVAVYAQGALRADREGERPSVVQRREILGLTPIRCCRVLIAAVMFEPDR